MKFMCVTLSKRGHAPGLPALDLPLVLYPEEGTNKYGDSHVVWFSPESRPCDFVQPSSMHNLQSEFKVALGVCFALKSWKEYLLHYLG